MAVSPPICDFGWKAPAFSLPATDGHNLSFSDIRGKNGTLVMFICNHCPYVLAVLDRMIREARELQKSGIGVVAISSNDAGAYPADSFDKMVEMAEKHAFPFPYLYDETKEVARAYDAVCTPDFFGFAADGGLQYRGRLDESGRGAAAPDARRELFEAMDQIARTGQGPKEQTPSMGCSIKWKVKS